MKSMTGYGSSRSHNKDLHLEISVKTVNGRFLDVRFHFPREYNALESELKQKVSEQFRRGTIDIYISRRVQSGAGRVDVEVNKELAKKWLDSYKSLAKSLGLESQVSLKTIAELPDVMKVVESSDLSTKEVDVLHKTLDKALKSCQQERVREGKALQKELLGYLKNLEELCKEMADYREVANQELKKKLTSRLEKSASVESVDPQRLAQEVAFYIDRSDINEEIMRLSEHVKKCRSLVRESGHQGKKLDFYSQELLREVNTIGSKSQVAKLTELVVNAKSVIEKFREQVQNVE